MNSKRALVLTNHLHDFAGSEVLALEVSETLATMGYEVQIHCNSYDNTIRSLNSDIRISDDERLPDLFDYDFVWSQHSLIPISIAQHHLRRTHRTRIVSAHLSPFEPFEVTGLKTAQILGATIVANSYETTERLKTLGVGEDCILNFHNACPDSFWIDQPKRTDGVRKLLWVTNHHPRELEEAVKLLKSSGVRITHLGNRGKRKRVTPEDITGSDAVIAIGKTVQYAMKAGVPVYCYDHYGGPGWITRENYAEAEYYNYSGRCCHRKLTPEAIADEIRQGWETASEDVLVVREDLKERYSLQRLLKSVTQVPPVRQFEDENEYRDAQRALALEAPASLVIRKLYRSNQQRRLKNKVRAKVRRLLRTK